MRTFPTITQRRLGMIIALAAIYFVAGKLGLQLAFINSSASAVWPSTGIALAAILLLGTDIWPGIFLGAFLLNAIISGPLSALGIAFGSTLEIMVAVYLLKKYAKGSAVFENEGDVFRFAMISFLSASVAAAIGTLSLWLTGSLAAENSAAVWFTWLLGDATGMLIFAPFIVLWMRGEDIRWKKEDSVPAGGLLLYILVIAIALCEHVLPVPLSLYPFAALIALILPPLVWAAFNFGRRITASTTILLSVIAIISTLTDPDLARDAAAANNALLFLQLFVGSISVFTLMFAITVYRQRKSERALARNEKHFRSLVENSSDGILLTNGAGVIEYVSPAVRHILGFVPEDFSGKQARDFIASEDREKYKSFVENLVRHPRVTATLELRATQKEGGTRWIEIAAVNLLNDPAVEAVVVNFRDITERKEVAAAKNNFISSVSYRLCPPLAQAETYIAALSERKKNLSPLEQKYLAQLDDANQKMITLTSDIIRLTRIELGTIRTSPKSLDLRKMMDETLRGATSEAQAKNIAFAWKHAPGRSMIMADANLLGLALQRLVGKLMKLAGEKGKIVIALEHGETNISLQFSSPSIRDLRKKLQINTDDLAFGFFMIQSLIELMAGSVHFEPTGDDGEMLVINLPKPVTTAENQSVPSSDGRSRQKS